MYLSGLRSDGIDIWDYQTKKHVATLTPSRHHPGTGYNRPYCISGDCRLLATARQGGESVVVWDISALPDGGTELYCTVPYYWVDNPTIPDDVESVCFTKNCAHLIAGYSQHIRAFNALDGCLLHVVECAAKTLVVHPVAEGILTASEEGMVTWWDAERVRGQRKQLETEIQRGCVAPSENLVAFIVSGGTIRILDVATLALTATIAHVECGVRRILFNAASTRILTHSFYAQANVRVYDVATATLLFSLYSFGSVCYDSDSAYIYGTFSSYALACWDAETGALMPDTSHISMKGVASPHDYYELVAFTPSSTILM
jgi:WD40 repeat protein